MLPSLAMHTFILGLVACLRAALLPRATLALENEVMGVEGIPIPYGAPNATPHVERFVRTLREEALDHFISLTVDHIRRVVSEHVRYYNGARPSQAIHAIPDPYPELKQPPPRFGKLLALPILGGVQHDYRFVA
ncbi:MAG: integrase core domain-containing protein [Candidatus Eisenbacteria bacterium]